ncbi:MAG: MotA/TolQ/ExbB proton channel family protein [Alphaproteobacteria bacterium]
MDVEPSAMETAAPATGALDSLLALVDAGGPVVLVLVGLSVVMVATVLMKLGQFIRAGVWRRVTADRAVGLARRGRLDEAIVVAGSGRGLAARIVGTALWGCRRGMAPGEVRDEVLRMVDEAVARLRSHVRILEVIASLAPLLGLFGTVLGMIDAFQNLEASGSRADPAILSGGIWEALLTTAVGLAVAMPAVVLVNLIDRAIESLAADLENMVAQIFNPAIAGAVAASLAHGRTGIHHGIDQQPVPAAE